MEEAGIETLTDHKCMFQMHQLIPDHLLRAAQLGITVVNYIVCPNVVDPPMFMASGDFVQTSKTEYKHKTHPITIHFFTTMMPTKDKDRNDRYMAHFVKNDFATTIPGGFEMYRQTSVDRSYVDKFYDILGRTVKSIGLHRGFASCFSFAVFNDDTINRKFNRCAMFNEILGCYPNSISSCLFEWVFRYGIYVVYNIHATTSSSPHPGSLCYVPLSALGPDAAKSASTCKIMEPEINRFGNVGFVYRMIKEYAKCEQEEETFDVKSDEHEDNIDSDYIPDPYCSIVITDFHHEQHSHGVPTPPHHPSETQRTNYPPDNQLADNERSDRHTSASKFKSPQKKDLCCSDVDHQTHSTNRGLKKHKTAQVPLSISQHDQLPNRSIESIDKDKVKIHVTEKEKHHWYTNDLRPESSVCKCYCKDPVYLTGNTQNTKTCDHRFCCSKCCKYRCPIRSA